MYSDSLKERAGKKKTAYDEVQVRKKSILANISIRLLEPHLAIEILVVY